MSSKPSRPVQQSGTECSGCAGLRREIEELRKRVDGFQGWIGDLHKVKCSCGKVATHIERCHIGSLAVDRSLCDACAKNKSDRGFTVRAA